VPEKGFQMELKSPPVYLRGERRRTASFRARRAGTARTRGKAWKGKSEVAEADSGR